MSVATETQIALSGWLARSVPALSWLRSYERAWLRPDLMAGVTLADAVESFEKTPPPP